MKNYLYIFFLIDFEILPRYHGYAAAARRCGAAGGAGAGRLDGSHGRQEGHGERW